MNDSFYKNLKYLELKNRLGLADKELLIEVIGEAIQYGIDMLAEDFKTVVK